MEKSERVKKKKIECRIMWTCSMNVKKIKQKMAKK